MTNPLHAQPPSIDATTVVRVDLTSTLAGTEALHPLLLAQLRELKLRTGSDQPEAAALLRLISSHYTAVDDERRGVVRTMQLMADEARALALEAQEQSSDHLQIVLDNIKDAVLTLDEFGFVQTFNPTAERVFGYGEAEAVGRRIEEFLPQLADRGDCAEALDRLAESTGDTHLDLSAREIRGRRSSGEVFAAEFAVSRARLRRRAIYVLCLRDITDRRETERQLRESELRYRMLVDHAPEAILVFDVDVGRYIDANANAERLFGTDSARLLQLSPLDLSPEFQPGGDSSAAQVAVHTAGVLAGELQVFEWVCRTARGIEVDCEMRLALMPSGTRRLIRISVTDISDRKRSERRAAAEREVLDRLSAGAPVPQVLEAVTQLIESVDPGSLCSVSILEESGSRFASVVAPAVPAPFREVLLGAEIGLGFGSCAAAVYLSRPVLVADMAKDPFWNQNRTAALRSGLAAAWSTPIKSAEGKMLGALGVYQQAVGLPDQNQTESIAHASKLAGIAIERLLAETHRKQAEQAVIAEKERAQVTLQSIGDGVISTCARGLIEYMNPVAEKLTGWLIQEARGRPLGEVLNLIDETTRKHVSHSLERMQAAGVRAPPAAHPVLVTREGHEVAVEESSAPIRDRSGDVIGAVIVVHDVTQERRLKRALSYQATHDALTGLINRREFDVRLRDALILAQRGERQFSLLYVDLDQFKVVNDTCGHQAGDRLMRDVTSLLRARVRAQDTIARLGGDEFGILLDGTSVAQAGRIADGVRQAIHNYRFIWAGSTLNVGASIGVVEINRDTDSVAAVLSAADIACYAAKEGGRNRVQVYDGHGAVDRHRELHWAARLTRAVEENRLELFYQPIVPIADAGPKDFHELTVQLRDDDGRLVPAGEFIPAAERYNVMPAIDRWVILRALERLRDAPTGPAASPVLAVNLSGNSLSDPSFLEFVVEHAGAPDVARRLCFEITETAAVTNWSNALYFMKELQQRGCRFALDDFGSGLASFMYLRTLPVDYLKIDGQFVAEVASNPVDRNMVEAICKIARSLGIFTVAECVESEPVLAELKRIGVDFVQGYYLARPQPISQLQQGA
ncbi:MAG TPA: EAL domain-containing protein [Steroidobacteraceae bacterium]|jgi:diguanylate cyclase (GGDEF)-like protein/PAS domain S-box-containing protein